MRRLVMIVNRFWPQEEQEGWTLATLVDRLTQRDVRVTLLTARWDPQWPLDDNYRGASIVRLGPPPLGYWNTRRYVRSLTHWLNSHRNVYQLVLVTAPRHEAYAAIRAVAKKVPVVLRVEKTGREGDCVWQLETGAGRRIKPYCMKAAALVGTNQTAYHELVASGYPRPCVYHLDESEPPNKTVEAYLTLFEKLLATSQPTS